MSLTLTLALRYLRHQQPVSALALTALIPTALMIAANLASQLSDVPALLLLGLNAILAVLASWWGLTQALVVRIQARRADFAALSEVGASLAQIRRLVVIETALLAGIGSVVGALIGLAFVALAGRLSLPSLPRDLIIAIGSGLAAGIIAGLIATRALRQL